MNNGGEGCAGARAHGARVRGARVHGCAIVLGFFVMAIPVSAQRTGLTGAAQLARIYDAVFDARFDQVPGLLAQTCALRETQRAATSLSPPPEACQVLELVSLWWQIQLDPVSPVRDAAFRMRADAAVLAAEAWTTREPERAEAWFYLGGAYGARVQWRVLRGERIAAARDGKRIKDALERALAIDPNLRDAYFGIGLYHYYADVAPAAAKMLRWLLLLPGGDKQAGMREMLRARSQGQLLRSEADYQLHVLYLWYEKQPQRALELLQGLVDRHPYNPHFPQLIAEIEDAYLHDVTASLRSWEQLLASARARRIAEPEMAEARARLGMALQLDRLYETDLAIDHLRAVIEASPVAPFAVVAQAHLQLGRALDRLGRRAEAVTAYRMAIASTPPGDPLKTAARARGGLRDTPNSTTARAYRLSIEGWRALERGALADASRAITQSLALRADDPVTRYRQARLLLAERHDAAALDVLDALVSSRSATPPTIYASACVEAARLHEQRGSIALAIDLYRRALTVFGADQRTKESAQRALTRLNASPSTAVRER